MRLNLKIGQNCSITKIDANKLNVKLNLGLNNFNNSSFKEDTRIYIENINFPVLQDSNSVDINNGTINILTNAIEPDFNDFNSYQNINNPSPIFSSEVNNMQYSSTSKDLYNFKINSSFMNNCNFTLEFVDIDVSNVFQKTVSQINFLTGGIAEDLSLSGPLVSGADLDVSIESGTSDSARDGPTSTDTIPTFFLKTLGSANSYTVSRSGSSLSPSDHPFLYNLSFSVVLDKTSKDVVGLLQTKEGGNGATFEKDDLITVDKSVFGSSAVEDVVFKVKNVSISSFEKTYNDQIAIQATLNDSKNKLLQNENSYTQHLLDTQNTLQQLQDELYDTHIPNYLIYLNDRITINSSLTTGKAGPIKLSRLYNGISTVANGDNTSLFYFFLHTAGKSPFNPSSATTPDSISTFKITDSFGNQTSLKDATDFVNTKWNEYWTQYMTFTQQFYNFNHFYAISFTNIGDRTHSGKGFPTENAIVWNSSGGNNFYETTQFVSSISENFTEVADATKSGTIAFDILMTRANNTNKLTVLTAVETFNASSYNEATTNVGQKILINNDDTYAFGAIKTMVIKSGDVDPKRKTKLTNYLNTDKGAYIVIPYQRSSGDPDGVATIQFNTNEKNIRGYDYSIGEEIRVPASFFEPDDPTIPCTVDLVIQITAVYDKVVPLELEIVAENLSNPSTTDDLGSKTIVQIDDAIEQSQFAVDYAFPKIPRTTVNVQEPISIVDHIISSNQLEKASISLNIYNELDEPDILKPNKSRFKQNNYQSTPLCPCRRYIR